MKHCTSWLRRPQNTLYNHRALQSEGNFLVYLVRSHSDCTSLHGASPILSRVGEIIKESPPTWDTSSGIRSRLRGVKCEALTALDNEYRLRARAFKSQQFLVWGKFVNWVSTFRPNCGTWELTSKALKSRLSKVYVKVHQTIFACFILNITTTERHVGLGSTAASYSKGLGLKSRLKIWKNWQSCFIQSLQTSMRIAP